MDITFTVGDQLFNYRVAGLFIREGRLLVMRDSPEGHWYLPGGRVAVGETAEAALLREMREELDISAEIDHPLWLNQGFFVPDGTDRKYHELCLYFLMATPESGLPTGGESFFRREGAEVHEFHWMPFAQLRDAYFYPLFLKEAIFHLPEALTLRAEYE